MVVFANHLFTRDAKLPLFLITGLMLGYVFTRSRYGLQEVLEKYILQGMEH